MDTNNKTFKEIMQMTEAAVESIRHRLSAILMDTSESNPLEVDITIEDGAMGLSEMEKYHIIAIYQEPSEGTIWVKFDKCNGYDYFDNLLIYDQIEVLKALIDKSEIQEYYDSLS